MRLASPNEMISLSLSRININSPCIVTAEDNRSFIFFTDEACYRIGFAEDYTISFSNVYQFYLQKVSGKSHLSSEVYGTVKAVIEEFFVNDDVALLYICDTSDNRQAARDRLFRTWYLKANADGTFIMHNASVEVQKVKFYAALITRSKSEFGENALKAFDSFASDFSDKASQWNE